MKLKHLFENRHPGFFNQKALIEEQLRSWDIFSYRINDDLTVDVDYQVDLDNKEIPYLPFKFGKVDGYFSMQNCRLRSLVGCPNEVHGDFMVMFNEIETLEGFPELVTGDIDLDNNKLVSLVGAPQFAKGSFTVNENSLKSLKGAPLEVDGEFHCRVNKLSDLRGGPREVGGMYDASYNSLITLAGAPKGAESLEISENPAITDKDIEELREKIFYPIFVNSK